MAKQWGAVETIKDLMGRGKLTPAVIAARLGIKNTAVWDRLNNPTKKTNNMKVDTMIAMLRSMDYKLVAVPATKAVKDDEYELVEKPFEQKDKPGGGGDEK